MKELKYENDRIRIEHRTLKGQFNELTTTLGFEYK